MARTKYESAPRPTAEMPRGIPYIIGNEFAERFSFYGMKGILVVFMTQYLMTHSGELDLMSPTHATAWYHMFTFAVYLTPLFGALIADVFLGKYMTIITLSLVYCAGHGVLAVDHTRFGLALGLGLIALGAGGIKPCVSAHVGDQFGSGNKHKIERVFGFFYIAINVGAFLSNILTPWLLGDPRFGPHWAFGLPGGLMLLATWVFWLGRWKFVHIQPGGVKFLKESFSAEGLRAVAKLCIIYVFVLMFWTLFDQTGSTWVIQARSMDREILGYTLFEAQFQAANPFLILVLIPLFAFVVYPAISKVFPLTPMRKITIGLFLAALSFAVPSLIESNITGGRLVKSSSQAARGDWSGWNLIDGDPDGRGWASKQLSSELVIDLGAEEPTPVARVEIDPDLDDVLRRLGTIGASAFPGALRDVTISVSDESVGPWTEVGLLRLKDEKTSHVFSEPHLARFVKLSADLRWGGGKLALGQVQVLDPKGEKLGSHDGGLAESVIRLREGRAWKINAIEVDPHVTGVMNKEDPAGSAADGFSDPARLTRAVSLLVSASPAGPWQEVGRLALPQAQGFRRLEFDAVDAHYVMVRCLANHGGNHVALGRVRVLAVDAQPPSDASPVAADAWPDVAAIGYKPHIWWQLLAYIVITAAEVMVSVTCLEFSYTQAPRAMKSFIMGLYFSSVAFGNLLVAGVNFFIENPDGTSKLDGATYYWFFTGAMFVTALCFIVVAKLYVPKTYIQEDADGGDLPLPEAMAEGPDER